MGKSSSLLVALLVAVTLASCSSPKAKEFTQTLQQIVSGKPIRPTSAVVWGDVRTFYERNSGAPVWITHRGKAKRANEAIDVLRLAPQHGLSADDYGVAELQNAIEAIQKGDPGAPERIREIAALEIRITAALFTLGRDVAIGRADLSDTPDWKPRRQAPDFVETLNTALQDRPITWLEAIRPTHPEYVALEKALGELRASREQKAEAPQIDARIRQIELNLNRWRWLPDDLGDRHFLINIPRFELVARESGKDVLNMRVVVGRPGDNTPIFSDVMETVVFSPYWNIPESIAEGETAPAIARDPGYLDKQGIDVLRVSGRRTERVDSSEVDFDDPEAMKDLVFRQRPGPGNALGLVKFLFPNPHNVYLHDTPSDRLFARERRAFSHGCIRVEEPERLAQYVLRDQPEWDHPRIAQAMASEVEKHVRLRQTIPVHIVYFTVSVDEGGGLRFLPDIYAYDRTAR